MTTRAHADENPNGLLPKGLRGRGAQINPGNRFESVSLTVLGEELDHRAEEHPCGRQAATQVLADQSRTIINPVDSPDLNFNWTINPYRGCEHGCIYCYARPTHEYLSLSCGIDFETKLLAKHDAPELLRRELASKKWTGETIVMSGITDPYQPIERDLRITRRCLEVMLEARQSVSIITKNPLILRDMDLIEQFAKLNLIRVAVSLTTLENDLAQVMEPRAGSPASRLKVIRQMSAIGVPVCVMTAPIIPGLNDSEIPKLLESARDAGATRAGYVLLRLPYQIKDLFAEWLVRHFPDRAAKIESLLRQSRDGALYDSKPFERMRGTGPVAENIRNTFAIFSKRLGLTEKSSPPNTSLFRHPTLPGETFSLFEHGRP